MTRLLFVLALLAAPLPAIASDEPPDFGRFAFWVRGVDRVELDMPDLGIPEGLYGPLHARALLGLADREHAPRVLEFSEIPLPNIPGRLRLFIVRTTTSGGRESWMLAYFSRSGSGPSPGSGVHRLDTWALIRLRQIGRS